MQCFLTVLREALISRSVRRPLLGPTSIGLLTLSRGFRSRSCSLHGVPARRETRDGRGISLPLRSQRRNTVGLERHAKRDDGAGQVRQSPHQMSSAAPLRPE